MTLSDGYVAVGPNWPGAWWSDGYSDYVRHFFDAMAAVPEWAPAGEDHLINSSSIVKAINYQAEKIEFNSFDNNSSVILRLTKKPRKVLVEDISVPLAKALTSNTWTWEALDQGGVMRLNYNTGTQVIILK